MIHGLTRDQPPRVGGNHSSKNQSSKQLLVTGDQQLFAGLILAAVIAAYTGRLIARQPVYHALSTLQSAPRR